VRSTPYVRRGRPPKFGQPGKVVALTLPEETIRGLRRVHADLAWAIVTLFENGSPKRAIGPAADAELVTIADRQSLIVVNRAVFKRLPGVNIIPLSGSHAFLALDPGQGLADLELAARDRLADRAIDPRERRALKTFRVQLRGWRENDALRFHTRSIIVIERVRGRRARR
jgi:hypothetical protein